MGIPPKLTKKKEGSELDKKMQKNRENKKMKRRNREGGDSNWGERNERK